MRVGCDDACAACDEAWHSLDLRPGRKRQSPPRSLGPYFSPALKIDSQEIPFNRPDRPSTQPILFGSGDNDLGRHPDDRRRTLVCGFLEYPQGQF